MLKLRNSLALVVLFFCWNLPPAFAVAAKKKPTVQKAQARKPAQQEAYACTILRHGLDGDSSEQVALNGALKFDGSQPHVQVELRAQGGAKAMVVTEYYDTPDQPYIVESLDCNANLGCKGRRTLYRPKGPLEKPVLIMPGVSHVRAFAGSRMMIEFKFIARGFAFESVTQTEPVKIGVEAACVSRN